MRFFAPTLVPHWLYICPLGEAETRDKQYIGTVSNALLLFGLFLLLFLLLIWAMSALLFADQGPYQIVASANIAEDSSLPWLHTP
jgi:hypothetical protein